MAREWYCELHTKNGQPRRTPRVFGPLRVRELKHLARTGQLTPTDRIRRGTDGPWRQASSLKGLFETDGHASSRAPRGGAAAACADQPAAAPAAVAVADASGATAAERDTRSCDGTTSPETAGPSAGAAPGPATVAPAAPVLPAELTESGIREWRKQQLLQQAQWMAQQIKQIESRSSSGEIPIAGSVADGRPTGEGARPDAAGLLPSQLQSLRQDPWYAMLQRRIQQAGILPIGSEGNPRQWYRESHGVISGPMLFEDLVLLARAGRLAVGDNIRWGASGPWIPLFPEASGSSWPVEAMSSVSGAGTTPSAAQAPASASAWTGGNESPSAVRRPRPPKLPPVRIPPPDSVPPKPVDAVDLTEPSTGHADPTSSPSDGDAERTDTDAARQRCSDAAAQLLAQFSGRSRSDAEKKAVDPLKLLRAKPKAFTTPTPPPSAPPRDVATGSAPARPAHATRTDIPRVPRKRPSRLPGQARWIALAAGVLLVLGGIYLISGGGSDARICRDLESIWSEFRQLRERKADAAEVQAFLDRVRPTLRRHRAYLEKTASRTERAKQRLLHLTQSLQEAITAADSGQPEISKPLEKTIEDGFADVHRLLGTTP